MLGNGDNYAIIEYKVEISVFQAIKSSTANHSSMSGEFNQMQQMQTFELYRLVSNSFTGHAWYW
jgi:hypothetical protein